VGDELVACAFPGTTTRGFAAKDDRSTAVCLKPGTEVAFPNDVWCDFINVRKGQRVGIVRLANAEEVYAHHDAIEFPDGQVILVHWLSEGQAAVVLQLPAEPAADKPASERGMRVFVPKAIDA
jgi:hypothetical protein